MVAVDFSCMNPLHSYLPYSFFLNHLPLVTSFLALRYPFLCLRHPATGIVFSVSVHRVRSFVQTDIVTRISYECLKQFQ